MENASKVKFYSEMLFLFAEKIDMAVEEHCQFENNEKNSDSDQAEVEDFSDQAILENCEKALSFLIDTAIIIIKDSPQEVNFNKLNILEMVAKKVSPVSYQEAKQSQACFFQKISA